MNRNRMLILAFFALALSALVSYFAYRMLQSRLNPTAEESVQIVVAAEKLNLGTRLTEQVLRVTEWPKSTPLEGSFSNPADIVGRGVIVPMGPNEPVLESKLASKEAGAGLTSAIPEGMRAVAVKVNDVIGVAGFVVPGTRVDVIIIGNPGQGATEVSKIFLENVQILAAGQNVEQDVNGKPQNVQVVTMLVTPEDAQKLALAQTDGRIQLALRNPIDLAEVNPAAVQKPALYGGRSSNASPPPAEAPRPRPTVVRYVPRRPAPAPAPAVVTPPRPQVYQIEMIHRDKRETTSFEKRP
ncbi:MAG TPA: Flp pilus assembly protein CpaB [Blastocatellia bacterium]|nr:Flp pilus assembly protein CpaB [Blastocatellia bacterium]